MRRRPPVQQTVATEPGTLGPILIMPPPGDRGRVAFDHVCGNCHPHAQADIGPRLVGIHRTESALRDRVRYGGLRMSAISPDCITDNELQDIIVYLRTIGTVAEE
jgi:hypothetical protein